MTAALSYLHKELRSAFPFEGVSFDEAALAVFRFQAQANPVYAEWLGHLRIDWQGVEEVAYIPFLPIGFFKTRW